jgi:hypothetical protein
VIDLTAQVSERQGGSAGRNDGRRNVIADRQEFSDRAAHGGSFVPRCVFRKAAIVCLFGSFDQRYLRWQQP